MLERIVHRREDAALEIEQDEVSALPGLERAEVILPGRLCAAPRRHRPRLTRAEPAFVVDVPELVQQARDLERRVGVVAVVRAHPVGAHRDVDARVEEHRDGGDAAPELHVRDRVVRDARPRLGDEVDVGVGQPDAVLEADARAEKADLVQVGRQALAVHLHPRERLHPRLEHVDVDRQVELVGERGARREHPVRAALRTRRAEADRDPLVGAVVALDGEARERLPLRPGRQPVGAEALAQLGRDEAEIEHNDLVVGAVGHADHDHGAQAEVAVRARDRPDRLLRPAGELVDVVDDARRPRADHLHPAEQRAHVELAVGLHRVREHGIGEEHPRLERQVVEAAAEPVLVRVVVRVDDPRHDGEPRAVDDLAAGRAVADGRDPTTLDRDVGAPELAPADVDEPVLQNDARHQE